MSIEDYARSLLAEAGAKLPQEPAPKPPQAEDSGPEDARDKRKRNAEPNEPDPEEVQYPGYFKGEGSL